MRKLKVGTFLSVDGVMQAPGAPDEDRSGGFDRGGWVVPYFDAVVDQAVGAQFERPYELLLGRLTYDIFAAHWPRAEDGPDAALARQFNATTKYVATRSTAPLAWRGSIALRDPVADVGRLKQEDGPDLLIQGSGVLVRSLLAAGLVDELTLLTFPVLLGPGKRLFDGEAMPSALTLVGSATSPSGVAIATWRPAGAVDTGSFALS
jgi:dihydrofolate reductase